MIFRRNSNKKNFALVPVMKKAPPLLCEQGKQTFSFGHVWILILIGCQMF